jgi:MFS family permease
LRRVFLGSGLLGFATGWNISNTGAVASQLAHSYGVSLATVGVFTSAFFAAHLVMQIPGGRASDRFGARRAGMLGLGLIAIFGASSMTTPHAWVAIVTRALTGVGTGLAFVAGSAYIRAAGGSPAAQGLYGGIGLAGGGLAIAIVPQAERVLGWRAPFATTAAIAAAGFVLLALAPTDAAPRFARQAREGILLDRRLYRLAALYAASLGLSVMVGNWVTTLLDRHGGLGKGAAGAVGSLTLVLGIVTRPLGGWILHAHPLRARTAVALSLVGGAAGTALLAVARPAAVATFGAALVGVAAGIPFSPAFTGAATLRPDAPAAAVGFVNGAASLVILAGTPLLGLSFSLPGDGRAGFAVVAALWIVALLALPTGQQLGASPAAIGSRSG